MEGFIIKGRFLLYIISKEAVSDLIGMGINNLGDPKTWSIVKPNTEYIGSFPSKERAMAEARRFKSDPIIIDNIAGHIFN